jgi:hypothetical protein
MTNLETLEGMTRYYRERIACAKATGDAQNAARLERNLTAFEHIRDLEHKRTLAADLHHGRVSLATTQTAVRGIERKDGEG